jgi:ABC-type sugar transport system ATPase subunit
VVFGIRPEDIYDTAGGGGRVAVDARVVAVEALGPEVILVAALPGGTEIAARLGRGFRAAVGATQRLYLDLAAMHLFDPETRKAIPRA